MKDKKEKLDETACPNPETCEHEKDFSKKSNK